MTYTAKTAKELRSEKGSLSKKLATQLGLIETELDGINRAATSYTLSKALRVGIHDWGAGSTGLEISTTDPLLQVAGKVTGEDVAQGVYVCSYNQLALINDQDEDVSMMASWNELYVTDADLTGSSNYAAVWGHIEAAGTVVSSTGNMSPLHGSLIIPAGYTNASGALLGGCIVDGKLHTSITNSGTLAAFAIGSHTDPNEGDWQYGLYMPANNVATGIYIGTCSGACIHMQGGADGSAEGDFWYDAAAHVLKYRDNVGVKTVTAGA